MWTWLMFTSYTVPSGEGHFLPVNKMDCLVCSQHQRQWPRRQSSDENTALEMKAPSEKLGPCFFFFNFPIFTKSQNCQKFNLKTHHLSVLSFKGQFIFLSWFFSPINTSHTQQMQSCRHSCSVVPSRGPRGVLACGGQGVPRQDLSWSLFSSGFRDTRKGFWFTWCDGISFFLFSFFF